MLGSNMHQQPPSHVYWQQHQQQQVQECYLFMDDVLGINALQPPGHVYQYVSSSRSSST